MLKLYPNPRTLRMKVTPPSGPAPKKLETKDLIVGTGPLARTVARQIQAQHDFAYRLVGFVRESESQTDDPDVALGGAQERCGLRDRLRRRGERRRRHEPRRIDLGQRRLERRLLQLRVEVHINRAHGRGLRDQAGAVAVFGALTGGLGNLAGLGHPDLPQVIAIERRAFPTPRSTP